MKDLPILWLIFNTKIGRAKKKNLIIALCLLAIAAVWTLVKFYLEFGMTK